MNYLSKQIRRLFFKKSVRRLHQKNFCIIANNCLGSKIYQILKIQYNTPFVGLFIQPNCFVKLAINFEHYIRQPLRFSERSKYEKYNSNEQSGTPYPLGLLDDVEIHFLHYNNENIAATKWRERCSRIDKDSLYYTMVADETAEPKIIIKYLKQVKAPRVCLHNKRNLRLPGSFYIPPVNGKMGNLYSKYERLVGYFNFANWILKDKSTKDE